MERLADWERAGRYEIVGGEKVFVREAGDGEPLLVLHGYPTASYDFARLVPLLSERFTLLLFDFPGYGLSEKANRGYTLVAQADVAEELARRRGWTSLSLLAHDMGSSVALELLGRASLTVTQLTLLNGSIWLEHYRPLITQRLLLHSLTGPLISGLGLIGYRAFARQFGSVFATQPPVGEIEAFWQLVVTNGGRRIQHRLIQYIRERRARERGWMEALARHPAPLSIIWGLLDPVARPAIADEVMRRRADARYVPLGDVGHYPQWEAPDQVAAAMLGAVRGPSSSTTSAARAGGGSDSRSTPRTGTHTERRGPGGCA